MNSVVEEWITKAEADYDTACRESRVRKRPNCDAVCFHSQQCLEKLFKAILIQHRIVFPKTHDLEMILNMCLARYPLWEAIRPDVKLLSRYAVQFRYPGESANRQEARRAVQIMRRCRDELRHALGLPPATGKRRRK